MLRQQSQEEMNGYRSTPPKGEVETVRKTIDRNTAEKVLETAALLQSAERGGLSVGEIEALAAKRGIAAHHVHQALALHGHATKTLPPVRLTRKQWRVSLMAVALYALFVIAMPFYVPAVGIVMGFLPILLCFALGYYLRYKRAGAVAGLTMMLATALSIALGTFARSGDFISDLFSQGLFYALAVWMATGAAGAALRQWIATRQSPLLPTVIRSADLDR